MQPMILGRVFVIEACEIRTRHKFYLSDRPGFNVLSTITQTDPYDKAVTHWTHEPSTRLAMIHIITPIPPTIRSRFSFTIVDLPDADLPTIYDSTTFPQAEPGDYVMIPSRAGIMLYHIQQRGCVDLNDPDASAINKVDVLIWHCANRHEAVHRYEAMSDRRGLLLEYGDDGRVVHEFRIGGHGLAVSARAAAVPGDHQHVHTQGAARRL